MLSWLILVLTFLGTKLAAKAFQVGDNHDRAVLTGAANSSALYQVVIDGQY